MMTALRAIGRPENLHRSQPRATRYSKEEIILFHSSQRSGIGVLAILAMSCAPNHVSAQTSDSPRPRYFAIRLGANFNPNTGPAVGLDYTFPQKSASSLSTRIAL